MTEINTHKKFNTVSHEHLDDLISWATGEYPDAGLVIVECGNSSWFIEQDYGHAYDLFSGISRPKINPYSNPVFYASREEALIIALKLIKQVHKNINEAKIEEYFHGD